MMQMPQPINDVVTYYDASNATTHDDAVAKTNGDAHATTDDVIAHDDVATTNDGNGLANDDVVAQHDAATNYYINDHHYNKPNDGHVATNDDEKMKRN